LSGTSVIINAVGKIQNPKSGPGNLLNIQRIDQLCKKKQIRSVDYKFAESRGKYKES
jgi:hypothetical protein